MADLKSLYARRLVDPNVKEGIREPLYSFGTYDSGVTRKLTLFQDKVGGTVTEADTNMNLAGQLEAGHKFIAETVEVHVLPGSNAASYVRQDPVKVAAAATVPNFANDVWALVSVGHLVFKIGDKNYLTAPLLAFPPTTGLGISPAAAVATTVAAATPFATVDYARLVGRPFVLNPVLPIPEQTSFSVSLVWPTAVALPSGFDARVGVYLGGLRFRN